MQDGAADLSSAGLLATYSRASAGIAFTDDVLLDTITLVVPRRDVARPVNLGAFANVFSPAVWAALFATMALSACAYAAAASGSAVPSVVGARIDEGAAMAFLLLQVRKM